MNPSNARIPLMPPSLGWIRRRGFDWPGRTVVRRIAGHHGGSSRTKVTFRFETDPGCRLPRKLRNDGARKNRRDRGGRAPTIGCGGSQPPISKMLSFEIDLI